MKKASRSKAAGELRSEYDFASLSNGVRGKYARARGRSRVAVLEPDVAQAFRTDASVNAALRTIVWASRASRRPR